jgi:hypothetical protein
MGNSSAFRDVAANLQKSASVESELRRWSPMTQAQWSEGACSEPADVL